MSMMPMSHIRSTFTCSFIGALLVLALQTCPCNAAAAERPAERELAANLHTNFLQLDVSLNKTGAGTAEMRGTKSASAATLGASSAELESPPWRRNVDAFIQSLYGGPDLASNVTQVQLNTLAGNYNPWGIGFAIFLIVLLPVSTLYVCTVQGMTAGSSQSRQSRYSTFAICALVVYVVLLMSADIVANRTAQSHGGSYPWNPCLAVFIVESAKFGASILLLLFEFVGPSAEGESEKLTEPRPEAAEPMNSAFIFRSLLQLLPTACIYAGNNCVNLFVLSKMHLDTFVIWRNMGILFNAIIWSQYFKKLLTVNQLVGICGMFIGCCLSDIQPDGNFGQLAWPILLVLFTALCSALGAVLNEGAFKSDRLKNASINVINAMLYAETACILGIVLIVYRTWSPTPVAEFSDLDRSAIAYISMQCVLGLCVSRVLKHADSVAKVVAGGVREVMTLLVAPLFVVSRLDWISLSSGLWVLFAVVTYFTPGPTLQEARDELLNREAHEKDEKVAQDLGYGTTSSKSV